MTANTMVDGQTGTIRGADEGCLCKVNAKPVKSCVEQILTVDVTPHYQCIQQHSSDAVCRTAYLHAGSSMQRKRCLVKLSMTPLQPS